jgi:DtxR family Mn-dependent transcriptional regulator
MSPTPARPDDDETRISPAVGDYLKAVWSLGRDGPVATSELASRLGVAPASVSGMVARLHRLGWLEHVPYHGVTLTPAGRRQALRLVRRHRLIETFLVEQLDYSWAEVHGEAEVLEHAVSDRFVDRVADLLGRPSHDPHGDPIPTADGQLPETPDQALTEVADRARFRIHRLRTQDPTALATLDRLGLRPGVELHRLSAGRGNIMVEVSGRRRRVPETLARCVHGESYD